MTTKEASFEDAPFSALCNDGREASAKDEAAARCLSSYLNYVDSNSQFSVLLYLSIVLSRSLCDNLRTFLEDIKNFSVPQLCTHLFTLKSVMESEKTPFEEDALKALGRMMDRTLPVHRFEIADFSDSIDRLGEHLSCLFVEMKSSFASVADTKAYNTRSRTRSSLSGYTSNDFIEQTVVKQRDALFFLRSCVDNVGLDMFPFVDTENVLKTLQVFKQVRGDDMHSFALHYDSAEVQGMLELVYDLFAAVHKIRERSKDDLLTPRRETASLPFDRLCTETSTNKSFFNTGASRRRFCVKPRLEIAEPMSEQEYAAFSAKRASLMEDELPRNADRSLFEIANGSAKLAEYEQVRKFLRITKNLAHIQNYPADALKRASHLIGKAVEWFVSVCEELLGCLRYASNLMKNGDEESTRKLKCIFEHIYADCKFILPIPANALSSEQRACFEDIKSGRQTGWIVRVHDVDYWRRIFDALRHEYGVVVAHDSNGEVCDFTQRIGRALVVQYDNADAMFSGLNSHKHHRSLTLLSSVYGNRRIDLAECLRHAQQVTRLFCELARHTSESSLRVHALSLDDFAVDTKGALFLTPRDTPHYDATQSLDARALLRLCAKIVHFMMFDALPNEVNFGNASVSSILKATPLNMRSGYRAPSYFGDWLRHMLDEPLHVRGIFSTRRRVDHALFSSASALCLTDKFVIPNKTNAKSERIDSVLYQCMHIYPLKYVDPKQVRDHTVYAFRRLLRDRFYGQDMDRIEPAYDLVCPWRKIDKAKVAHSASLLRILPNTQEAISLGSPVYGDTVDPFWGISTAVRRELKHTDALSHFSNEIFDRSAKKLMRQVLGVETDLYHCHICMGMSMCHEDVASWNNNVNNVMVEDYRNELDREFKAIEESRGTRLQEAEQYVQGERALTPEFSTRIIANMESMITAPLNRQERMAIEIDQFICEYAEHAEVNNDEAERRFWLVVELELRNLRDSDLVRFIMERKVHILRVRRDRIPHTLVDYLEDRHNAESSVSFSELLGEINTSGTIHANNGQFVPQSHDRIQFTSQTWKRFRKFASAKHESMNMPRCVFVVPDHARMRLAKPFAMMSLLRAEKMQEVLIKDCFNQMHISFVSKMTPGRGAGVTRAAITEFFDAVFVDHNLFVANANGLGEVYYDLKSDSGHCAACTKLKTMLSEHKHWKSHTYDERLALKSKCLLHCEVFFTVLGKMLRIAVCLEMEIPYRLAESLLFTLYAQNSAEESQTRLASHYQNWKDAKSTMYAAYAAREMSIQGCDTLACMKDADLNDMDDEFDVSLKLYGPNKMGVWYGSPNMSTHLTGATRNAFILSSAANESALWRKAAEAFYGCNVYPLLRTVCGNSLQAFGDILHGTPFRLNAAHVHSATSFSVNETIARMIRGTDDELKSKSLLQLVKDGEESRFEASVVTLSKAVYNFFTKYLLGIELLLVQYCKNNVSSDCPIVCYLKSKVGRGDSVINRFVNEKSTLCNSDSAVEAILMLSDFLNNQRDIMKLLIIEEALKLNSDGSIFCGLQNIAFDAYCTLVRNTHSYFIRWLCKLDEEHLRKFVFAVSAQRTLPASGVCKDGDASSSCEGEHRQIVDYYARMSSEAETDVLGLSSVMKEQKHTREKTFLELMKRITEPKCTNAAKNKNSRLTLELCYNGERNVSALERYFEPSELEVAKKLKTMRTELPVVTSFMAYIENVRNKINALPTFATCMRFCRLSPATSFAAFSKAMDTAMAEGLEMSLN